jgi:hypothetical protein
MGWMGLLGVFDLADVPPQQPGPMRGKARGITKSPKRGKRRNRRKP